MRVRDLKRRLSRAHGYGADELERILDKKELIHALAFEEEKVRRRQAQEAQRVLAWRAVWAAVVAVVVVVCWPLLQHAFEVGHVHVQVYADRKRHEAGRCWELQSKKGLLGIVLMAVLDGLQLWLTVSVLLSWVTTSRYFFPVPRLAIRPAALLGGEMAQSPMANYGINLGSMLVTWGMRFVYGRVEQWTGRALAAAHRKQRQAARAEESVDDKAARKAARKQAKLEKQQRLAAQQAAAAAAASHRPPPSWMEPLVTDNNGGLAASAEASAAATNSSRTHQAFLEQLDEQQPTSSELDGQEFLEQLDEHTSELDELD